MKETIMIFNFKDNKKLLSLKRALLPFHVYLKEVKKEDYSKPLSYLAGFKDINVSDEIYNGDELESEMLIFSGILNNKLEQILNCLNKNKLKIPYKAILTPTNQNWTPVECFVEIKKEHELLNQQQS